MGSRVNYILFSLLASSQFLYPFTSNDKIEMLATDIDSNSTVTTANKEVLLYYEGAVIRSDSVKFNKKTNSLVVDGKIESIGYNGTKEHSDHIEIDTKDKSVKFDTLFMVNENDIWVLADDATKTDSIYIFGASVISSCDITNPIWKISFSDSIYDRNDNYMKIYNAKLYLGDIPVFYTPYFSFTTNNERSSGLLFPSFGYTESEGFLYEQPIYWSISKSMDLELNPQYRSARSLGLYGTFRFVDSIKSHGEIRAGYFKDKQTYVDENDILDDSHYGIEFNYVSTDVLGDSLKKGFKDGLYINSTFLNNIDYINLQESSMKHFGLTPLQESRVNYFMYSDDYYAGLNGKYFVDTRKENNDDTLQILPSIHLHKYLTHLIWNNLTYSGDMHINHFNREKGLTLKQVEFKVPLEWSSSFFNDYLNFSFSEEMYYSKFFFNNGVVDYDDFQYYSNVHSIKLYSDLTKKYRDFIHVLQPTISYINPGTENETPMTFSELNNEQKSMFAVGLPEEQYRFTLSQYFYNNSMKLKFFQRVSQVYYNNGKHTSADIENEMQYNWANWRFYSNVKYSPEYNKLRESSSQISITKTNYNFAFSHTYKQVLPDLPNSIPSKDILFSFGYDIDDKIKISGGFAYDLKDDTSKQWRFGVGYYRDCWSVDTSIRQDIIPRPTRAERENSFFIQLNFIPFGEAGAGTK